MSRRCHETSDPTPTASYWGSCAARSYRKFHAIWTRSIGYPRPARFELGGQYASMIPPCGTFDYVTTVPIRSATSPWPVTSRDAVPETGHALRDDRLVGLAPRLVVADAGPTPNPGYEKGVWRPNVSRCRITLEASSRVRATVRTISFHVDRGLVSALKPGDSLSMARTSCGGVGLSVIRDNELFYAAGVVTVVPLVNVEARVLFDLTEQAENPFRERDPVFELPEVPLEIAIGGRGRVLLQGRCTLEQYKISVIHGFYRGTPGRDECAAISRSDAPNTAASASAALLDADGLDIARW